MSQGIDVVFGTAAFGSYEKEKNQAYLTLLQKHNFNKLDTAALYENSEKALKPLDHINDFVIDTKIMGFRPNSLSRDAIIQSAKTSLEDLGMKSVNILYWHSPDASGTAFSEGIEAMDQLYKEGVFKRFGISNFTPAQVKEIYQYAHDHNLVKPTVFQGNYNPVARNYDTTLFPLLHELKISFYAYSPLAGGFLVKDVETLKSGGEGRWDPESFLGKMYHTLYNRPSLMEALVEWAHIAKDAGVTKAELAYRWVRYNSPLKPENGDAIILGATSEKQLEETLATVSHGPLKPEIVARIDQVWEKVKDEAPTDNFHDAALKMAPPPS